MRWADRNERAVGTSYCRMREAVSTLFLVLLVASGAAAADAPVNIDVFVEESKPGCFVCSAVASGMPGRHIFASKRLNVDSGANAADEWIENAPQSGQIRYHFACRMRADGSEAVVKFTITARRRGTGEFSATYENRLVPQRTY